MTKKERALAAAKALEELYPDALCALNYTEGYELMIAGRLSAQCTDKRVNIVTEDLFKKYPTLEAFANADVDELAEIIKPCGLYRTKAKSIVEMAQQLLALGGKIPDNIEELTKLSGIGRKTANLIMGDIHHKPAIVADTHFIRITGRLGLSSGKDPIKVEAEMRKIVPPEISSDFCHRVVLFGRDICSARAPKCLECPMISFCPYAKKVDKKA